VAGNDLGVAIEERRGFNRSSPQHLLGEAWGALRGIELMPNGGMDPVGADKNFRLIYLLRPGLPLGKVGAYAVIILLKAGEPQSPPNIFLADAVAHGADQEKLELAAMNRILRPTIPGSESPGFVMDELAELVTKIEPTCCDTSLSKSVAESKLRQFADRGRLQIDADPERRGIPHCLVNADRYSSLM